MIQREIDHVTKSGKNVEQTAEFAQNAQNEDLIQRKAAIDALARMMPRSYTPDGSHPADEEIFRAQEVFADCIEALEILPSAQPNHIAEYDRKVSISCGRENDLISRQAVIDALAKFVPYAICDESTESYANGLTDAYNLILQLPSAQPETAKRIVRKSRGGMTFWYQCDMCNEPVNLEDLFCCGCGRRLTDG